MLPECEAGAPGVPRHDGRPRLSPAELVASFAARGVLIEAMPHGMLCVSPADALSDADRAVLLAYKPGILAALGAPVGA